MKKRLIFFLEVLFATLLLDQVTKYWITQSAENGRLPIEIIPNLAHIILFKNTGIAFSIPIPSTIIIPLVLVLIIIGTYYLYKELDLRKPLAVAALGLVLGGAIGNVIDRLRFDYVIDFISIWKFPVFNIADIAITAGIGMLVLWYGVLERKK